MKKRYYLLIAIVVVVIAGYLYIRLVVLKTKTDHQNVKSTSVLDLTPAIINKLDELVKDGSDGLYTLSIESLNPDIAASTIDVYNVKLIPDSAAIKRLDSLEKLPDDVFRISVRRLHITNVSPTSFIGNGKIDIDSILLDDPVINVYHKDQAYNTEERRKASDKTLYEKLTGQFKSISIKAIVAKNGSFASNDVRKKKIRKFSNVSIAISGLLIDSTTQFDKSRVLFSREVSLSSKNYLLKTADSLYDFKIDSINVSASRHSMIAFGIALLPRENKQQFEQKLTKITDRFAVRCSRMSFTNIDWWGLVNNERFVCDVTDLYNPEIDDYLDRTLPRGSKITYADFPSQLMMQLPVKLNIGKVNLHNGKVVYEELAPESGQSGTVYFTAINGEINNVTNIRSAIKVNRSSTASASGMFMKTVPINAKIMFDLLKKDGTFTAEVSAGSMDTAVINPVGEPLGLVTLQSGIIHNSSAQVTGNNYKANASVLLAYNDLRLMPLKKDRDEHGLKKRPLLGLLANTFVIKKDNPRGNKAAVPVKVSMERGTHGTFFNFVWGTIRKGILKTIGVPAK